MSGETIKVRETRRLAILAHNAVTNVLNDLKEEDYPLVHTSMGRVFTEDIASSYYRYLDHFKMVYSDTPERKITIFDKALCLAMSLERNKVITTSELKGRVPKRMMNLNEKLITEIVLAYIGHSTYHVKRTDISGDFSFEAFPLHD